MDSIKVILDIEKLMYELLNYAFTNKKLFDRDAVNKMMCDMKLKLPNERKINNSFKEYGFSGRRDKDVNHARYLITSIFHTSLMNAVIQIKEEVEETENRYTCKDSIKFFSKCKSINFYSLAKLYIDIVYEKQSVEYESINEAIYGVIKPNVFVTMCYY